MPVFKDAVKEYVLTVTIKVPASDDMEAREKAIDMLDKQFLFDTNMLAAGARIESKLHARYDRQAPRKIELVRNND
jgi:hypothetical protein